MPNSTLLRYADDITVIGLTMNYDKSDNRDEIEQLVKWNKDNNIILNVEKT